jgi:hypothetical protein
LTSLVQQMLMAPINDRKGIWIARRIATFIEEMAGRVDGSAPGGGHAGTTAGMAS